MNTHDITSTKSNKPGSFIGAIIAIAIIVVAIIIQTNAMPAGTSDIEVPPITSADHLRGGDDFKMKVQVIEYSDLECPFCKDFHNTMTQIFAEYGTAGKIAWAYRHFPLTQLHEQATPEAIASECVAKLAGNEAFWSFTDGIFATTKSNDGLDLKTLPALAAAAGVKDIRAFNNCYTSRETAGIVASMAKSGADAGAQGTPYTIVISTKGNKFVIGGAYPYEQVKKVIDKAIKDSK